MIIYLGTIAITFIIEILFVLSLNQEIKNRGYKEVKQEKNKFQSILDFLQVLLLNSIPVLNIATVIAMIFKSKEVQENLISDWINEGKIIEKTKIEPEEQEEIKKQLSKVIVYNTHNELTREEKIKFLKEEYARLTGEELNTSNIRKDKQKSKNFVL